MRSLLLWFAFGAILFLPAELLAQAGIPAFTVESDDGTQTYTLNIQALVMLTALTLLPAALLTMTSFTRIIIVLAILRQALGTSQTPSNQILLGIALFLSLFIMSPVLGEIGESAVHPYLDETIDATQALQRASVPLRQFMLEQTREDDLMLFAGLSNQSVSLSSVDDIPFSILIPSFVTSELKTAFQIGFMLFVPFLIVDLVVASVLMSMGMMMLSPLIVSLPFKLMLFVLVDGWALVLGTLASSFYVSG